MACRPTSGGSSSHLLSCFRGATRQKRRTKRSIHRAGQAPPLSAASRSGMSKINSGLAPSALRTSRAPNARSRFLRRAAHDARPARRAIVQMTGIARAILQDTARLLPCRITLRRHASSSLRAADLTSFGPIAAKRLDDVRRLGAMTNKEPTVGTVQRRIRSGRTICLRKPV